MVVFLAGEVGVLFSLLLLLLSWDERVRLGFMTVTVMTFIQ